MRKWRAEIWIAAIVVVASAVTGYYMLRPTGGISVPSTTLSGRLTLSPYAAMGTPAAISTAGLGPGEWTVSAYGGCTDLTCDLSGNIYLVDATYTEADCTGGGADGTRVCRSPGETHLKKFDSSGTCVWMWTMESSGGYDWLEMRDVETDSDGNIYVAGYTHYLADFDPGPGDVLVRSNGASDAFLCKLDSSGDLLWVRSWGGTYFDGATGLAIARDGEVYVAGHFYDSVDFDPSDRVETRTSSKDNFQYFVSAFDDGGNFLWVDTWGEPGGRQDFRELYNVDLGVDGSGNVCIAAPNDSFPKSDTQGQTIRHLDDTVLRSLDPQGNLRWEHRWHPSCLDIALDSEGNLYAVGTLDGEMDFDPGPPVTPSGDGNGAFLCSFDRNGHLRWAHTWGKGGSDNALGVTIDANGIVHVVGQFNGSLDLAPGDPVDIHTSVYIPACATGVNSYTMTLDRNGNWIESRTWVCYVRGELAAGNSGNIYTNATSDTALTKLIH